GGDRRRGGEVNEVEAELRGGGIEGGEAGREGARGENGDGDRGVEEPEQLGHVDVLAGEAGANHVVGVGEQLDPGAVQVGVQAAGRHEHRLAGLQHRVPHQQQGDHANVARVVGGDPD